MNPEAESEAWLRAGRTARAAIALDDLLALVRSAKDWRVRVEAMPRLRARFGTAPEVAAALRECLSDPNPEIRSSALDELGWIKSAPDLGEVIVPFLEDADPEVRQSAALALNSLGDPRTPEGLEAWLLVHGPPDEDCEA